MKKEFVPYEQALAIKELGFDEPCLLSIVAGDTLHLGGNDCDIQYEFPITKQEFWIGCNKGGGARFKNPLYEFNIPTFSQAFRWFREKHKYDITIPPSGDSSGNTIGYYYEIIFQGWDDGIESDSYDTYEEAQLECLKKLIEIVKTK